MNQNEIKRLKEVVIYKGLGYFQNEYPLVAGLEEMGYIELDTNRRFATPTQKGIDFLVSKGYLEC